jgi:hypothetical protein
MKILKMALQAFLVGGLLSVVGHLFLVLLPMLLGPESMWIGPIALVLMGVVTLILYPSGLFKKLVDFGGFGVMLTFTGLAGAVAMTYQKTKKEKGTASAGIAAGALAVAYIVGIGAIATIVVALIVAFVL